MWAFFVAEVVKTSGQPRSRISQGTVSPGPPELLTNSATCVTTVWRAKKPRLSTGPNRGFRYQWLGAGSNRRHRPFQGRALPTELPNHSRNVSRTLCEGENTNPFRAGLSIDLWVRGKLCREREKEHRLQRLHEYSFDFVT